MMHKELELPVVPSHISIPFGVDFAATFADFLIKKHHVQTPEALADVTIWVPSRRAAAALESALVAACPQGLILPTLQPMALTEEEAEPFTFTNHRTEGEVLAEMPPPVQEGERLVYLAQQVLLWQKAAGLQKGLSATQQAKQAYSSALSLVGVFNRMVNQNIPFEALKEVVPSDMANHWQQSLSFLKIVFEFYPQWLLEGGVSDPAALNVLRLKAQCAHYKTHGATGPIYIVGFADTTPHGYALFKAILGTGQGCMALQGLEGVSSLQGAPNIPDASPTWDTQGSIQDAMQNSIQNNMQSGVQNIPPSHPQYGMHKLLEALGLTPADFTPLLPQPVQAQLLMQSQLPSGMTHRWQEESLPYDSAEHLSLLQAPTPRLEAEAIALYMRRVLEENPQQQQTCALVTLDRGLASRVADRLQAWGIYVDDSAGKPLTHTTAGGFFLSVVEVIAQNFPPALVAQLLAHPLCGGVTPEDKKQWKEATRLFEVYILRGQKPVGGLQELESKLSALQHTLQPEVYAEMTLVMDTLKQAFIPFMQKDQSVKQWLAVHQKALEILHKQSFLTADSRTYEGSAVLQTQIYALEESGLTSALSLSEYLALLNALFAQISVRQPQNEGQKLFIWGPLEARLQPVDHIIIGGVNEGVWPNPPKPDPWINHEMAKNLGLPPAEVAVGLNAHDFCALAAHKKVFITRALEKDGAETVPSRYLLRLQALLSLQKGQLDTVLARGQKWLTYAQALLVHTTRTLPKAAVPNFKVPSAVLPQVWSPSALATLMACPYKLYAEKVLKLNPLPDFDETPDAATKGALIHRCFEAFYKTIPNVPGLPPAFEGPIHEGNKAEARRHLAKIAEVVFKDLSHGPSRVVWLGRFQVAVEAFINQEVKNYANNRTPWRVEATAEAVIEGVHIKARADRVDMTPEGAIVMDYKTGSAPTMADVTSGKAPQLTLEAALINEGAFIGTHNGTHNASLQNEKTVTAVEYWKVGHATEAFKCSRTIGGAKLETLTTQARVGLKALAHALKQDVPLSAQPELRPGKGHCQWCAYAGLCRKEEWFGKNTPKGDA